MTLPGAASSLSCWIMGIKRQQLALALWLPATVSETSPGPWNVAPGVASSPSQAMGVSRQPGMWVWTAPGLVRGTGVSLSLHGAAATQGKGFGFSSCKIAAGDPLGAGKLLLERDY